MAIEILVALLRVYEMLLLIRILLSWIPVDPSHQYIELLIRVTDPVLGPARELWMRLMDRLNFQIPIDLSPIFIFLALQFLERTLLSFAYF
jgi:YggT family protein